MKRPDKKSKSTEKSKLEKIVNDSTSGCRTFSDNSLNKLFVCGNGKNLAGQLWIIQPGAHFLVVEVYP